MEEILREGLKALGLSADGEAIDRFRRYYDYLQERNAVMNLTAIKGAEDTARLHFLDCCALLGAADFKGRRVIDVGTGAGFPGLPLKIMEPGMRLTLLDSQEKRMNFLREVCGLIGIGDVDCVTARAEEPPPALRAGFDIAVSRAVARLCVLCELCLPFVDIGGLFIAMKGPDCGEEIAEAQKAIEVLGGEYQQTFFYTIPGTEIRHAAVIIKKICETPRIYPRRWAKIAKQPL
ncbi:MAG TPA: 16S rRNA (guanine(527)-N(7))-methyltransferase RsmG [Clostridiales bacterium]|nr:16S rRNA (guanine(527)-N(7))-methyltransferase RsmG [Clostridiales bacterium]HBR07841.1 16S rRNA (guanine(527)-N(7))-methyltransferase RsmG [Clostridiales bacterium]